MKVQFLIYSVLISWATAYSVEANAQAYSIPAGFASSGVDPRIAGYEFGVHYYQDVIAEQTITALGCLPTDLQISSHNYSQVVVSQGSLAAGEVVEFTQTICSAEGRTPGYLDKAVAIYYKGDLSAQVISPSGKVYSLVQKLQNSFMPTRYALEPWVPVNNGSNFERNEAGVWRLRLMAGKRGAAVPLLRWSATSNYGLP